MKKLKERGKINIYIGSLCFDFSVVQCSVYVEIERDIYWDTGKNKEIILSFLQACFVITHSSGDFIVKNICNHRLYTLQICKIGVVVNFNALFNCYAVKLSVAV